MRDNILSTGFGVITGWVTLAFEKVDALTTPGFLKFIILSALGGAAGYTGKLLIAWLKKLCLKLLKKNEVAD